MHRWRALVLVALLALLALLAQGRASPLPEKTIPVTGDDQHHRLDGRIVPSDYHIELTPRYPDGGKIYGTESFNGEVEIIAKVKIATAEILLHCDENIVVTADDVNVYMLGYVNDGSGGSGSGSGSGSGGSGGDIDDTEDTGDTGDTEEPEYILIPKTGAVSANGILTITFPSEIDLDTDIKIVIEYSRPFVENELSGFYISNYQYEDEDGETHDAVVLATQFEATSARKAFPCIDQPEFKAVFHLTIHVPTGGIVKAIANTPRIPEETRTGNIDFEATPLMPTYLLAFVVYESDSFHSVSTQDERFTTYGRKGEVDDKASLSNTDGPAMITYLSEYTGLNYYDTGDHNMGFTKMDQAAIPDFQSGAMENWGLVTYRESYLLAPDSGRSAAAHKRVSQVIAHELAHQWFGNWVTTAWWSTIWLNEGFADLFEHIVMEARYPQWGMEERFVLDEQMAAFDADSYADAWPLTHEEVQDPAQISQHFSTLTYSKGGSILRQIRNILGKDSFQEAIQNYLAGDKPSAVTPDDLFEHFIKIYEADEDGDEDVQLNQGRQTKTGLPPGELEKALISWTEQAGYPVITVTEHNDQIMLTQDRFLFPSDETSSMDTSYYVYLTWVTNKDDVPSKIEDVSKHRWMIPGDPEHIPVEEDEEWILVNPLQAGYYRVDYDGAMWDKLTQFLKNSKENLEKISDIDRAALINNALSLARERKSERHANYERAFMLMTFLKEDTAFAPWAAARSSLAFIERMVGTTRNYRLFISTIIEKVFGEVGFDISSTTASNYNLEAAKRLNVLTLACAGNYEDCIKGAETLLEAYLDSDEATDVHVDIQSVVYCYGLKGQSGADLWEKLWDKYLEAIKDQTRRQLIASALGCVNDEDTLKKYLGYSLEDDKLPYHERYTAFTAVYANLDKGVDAALNFLKEQGLSKLSEAYGENRVSTIINGLAARLTEQDQLDTLIEIIEDDEDKYSAAKKSAEANVDWIKENGEVLDEALRKASGAPVIALAFSLVVLCATLLTLLR